MHGLPHHERGHRVSPQTLADRPVQVLERRQVFSLGGPATGDPSQLVDQAIDDLRTRHDVGQRANAVVSWPAIRIVMSPSRTSWSPSGEPSSCVAASKSSRTFSPLGRPSPRRRIAMSSNRSSSRSLSCRNSGTQRDPLSRSIGTIVMSTRPYRCRPLDRNVSILRSKRSISRPGVRPRAVRRMTRSVIFRMTGRAGNGASRGNERAASNVSSRMASKNDRIRSPFRGGTRTRRCRRVWCPVEHQDRVPPNGRGKYRIGIARVQHFGVAAKNLADGLRVGQHHKPAVAGDVEREGITVKAVALVQQSERVARETDELPPCRRLGTCRKDVHGGRGDWRRGHRADSGPISVPLACQEHIGEGPTAPPRTLRAGKAYFQISRQACDGIDRAEFTGLGFVIGSGPA